MAGGLDGLKQQFQDWLDKKERLEGEILDLRRAYNDLVGVKKQAEKLGKRMTKTVSDDSSKWAGAHYSAFVQNGSAAVNNVNAMVQSMDTIADEINWCIKDRQDEIFICGYFMRSLNTQIQNWTN